MISETRRARRAVVALGGNALKMPKQKGSLEEMMSNAQIAADQIALLQSELGFSLVLTHGNGPQVGSIVLQNELAQNQTPAMPLFVCGSQSQGQLGYILQSAIDRAFASLKVIPAPPTVTVVTRVRVDIEDKAFANPSKPIGQFMREEEAEKVRREQGKTVVEDAGRGWRVIVPSPDPAQIMEADAICSLVSAGMLVIACGGGGIPVVADGAGTVKGVDAVIDKDLAGERLANVTNADVFVILTDVDGVYLNYNKQNAELIRDITPQEMRKLLREGQFAKGSMGPKVEAACRFVENRPSGIAVITSLGSARDALLGKCGTTVHSPSPTSDV